MSRRAFVDLILIVLAVSLLAASALMASSCTSKEDDKFGGGMDNTGDTDPDPLPLDTFTFTQSSDDPCSFEAELADVGRIFLHDFAVTGGASSPDAVAAVAVGMEGEVPAQATRIIAALGTTWKADEFSGGPVDTELDVDGTWIVEVGFKAADGSRLTGDELLEACAELEPELRVRFDYTSP